MKVIDQYKALFSLENALCPDTIKIDERTEKDRLYFLANFATLINFYDSSNSIYGNWSPILLKDPIFLLAFISKTKYSTIHNLYLNNGKNLERLLEPGQNLNSNKISEAMTQFIDGLLDVFKRIEKWNYYMDKSDEAYNLRTYIKQEIKEVFSTIFWAILELREQMILVGKIMSSKPSIYKEFDSFTKKPWKNDEKQEPYWVALDIIIPDSIIKKINSGEQVTNEEIIKSISNETILKSLTKVGDKLFTFLKKVIVFSNEEFDNLKTNTSKFPDTTLLRAFVNLMEVQKKQLNSLTKKHLHFYYSEILKQTKQNAQPDLAFICPELAKKSSDFKLPKGSLFNAGLGTNKNPIVFETIKNVNLNPAKIADVYTLSAIKSDSDSPSNLNLLKITNPSTVQKDEDGKILKWDTFGNDNKTPQTPTEMGFAFASPMLLMMEGKRNLTITLEFDRPINPKMFSNAKFYLSTENAWHEIKSTYDTHKCAVKKDSKNKVLYFEIPVTYPAIQAFNKNPDGLNSKWPMFKVVFSEFFNLNEQFIIEALTIDVNVHELKSFQLYNDSGSINTTKPFLPFGATPSFSSNFIIGSSEIFSKPFTCLTLQLIWDKLPSVGDNETPEYNFETYYTEYNNYLNHKYDVVKGLFGTTSNDSKNQEFKNTSFKVSFDLLQNGFWQKFDLIKEPLEECTQTIENIVSENTNTELDLLFEEIKNQPSSCQIDQINTNENNLSFCKNFSFSNKEFIDLDPQKEEIIYYDPLIQNSTLKVNHNNSFGFLKMSISSPFEGFGIAIYPKVVSAIALVNAAKISEFSFFKKKLEPAPNPPFIPKVKSFTATYNASKKYCLKKGKVGGYPIQCFNYSPFANYSTYDNSLENSAFTSNNSLSLNAEIKDANGKKDAKPAVTLFPSFKYNGALFIGLENAVIPNDLSFYFELAQTFNNAKSHSKGHIKYSYLSTTGWKNYDALFDGTHNFSCSGLINLNLPEDISKQSETMPEGKYWLSISVCDSIENYAQTLFMNSNGVQVKRSGTSFLQETDLPKIEPNTITKPHTSIPEISSLQQPFNSFDGKGAETTGIMNRRVSDRIKTKDRIVTASDIFNTVLQQFNTIYYCKTKYKRRSNKAYVRVVKLHENWTDSNAFTPLVGKCEQDKIKQYLNLRSSSFMNIEVLNFSMEPVIVNAEIVLKTGFKNSEIEKKIGLGIKIFLSPWIESELDQIQIDTEITTAQIANHIKSNDEVEEVNNISLELSSDKNDTKQHIKPSSTILFVPAQEQGIIFKEALND